MSATRSETHGVNHIKSAPVGDIEPEFGDYRVLERMFGIRRSFAYVLSDRGDIRSVCIRRPGAIKGKRLFDLASVRAFLHRQMKRGGAK
ncbi:MAG: hypothetical protein IT577_24170 [Verrucomicrobiae bacterium]|nr:hypothetical protein [Verrucomicrobiae bacterium]